MRLIDENALAKMIATVDAHHAANVQLEKNGSTIHARWIDLKHGVYKCSNCGNYLDFGGVNAGRGDANYCPNCGAKMDGDNENG